MHVRALLMASLLVPATNSVLAQITVENAVSRPLAASAPTVVPALVSYVGAAVNHDGKPLAAEATMTFLLFKDATGGEPLWTESQRVEIDATGAYKVQLGASLPSGLPLEVFSTGEARWLEVQVAGQAPQPRVLLTSVPYAAKAADAATLGGLPPSAFALAGSKGASTAVLDGVTPDASSNVTTTGGTSDYLPKFTGASTVANSQIYDNGTNVGIGVVPNSTVKLDVGGAMIMRGPMIVSRAGNATSSKGYPSYDFAFYANAYNSSTKATDNPHFQLQSEPVGNNTATTSATFNLLYSNHGSTPAETGFSINPTGIVHFASGQTFPGAGTVSSVGLSAPASDFTVSGSPVTTEGSLGLNWAIAPTSADIPDAIVKRDQSGNIEAYSIIADGGLTGFGSSSVSAAVYGENISGGDGVYGVGATGVFGSGSDKGFATDSNVQQARSAGGWVKAMVFVNGASSPYKITRCFNSTLVGSAATTVPCGIDLEEVEAGEFELNFNFQVNDRFYSATIADGAAITINAFATGTDQITTTTYSNAYHLDGAEFSLIVF